MTGEPSGALACPECKHPLSFVVDSRGNMNSTAVRRRRQCFGCHARFTTYESVRHPSEIVELMTRAAVAVRHARDALEAVERALAGAELVKGSID